MLLKQKSSSVHKIGAGIDLSAEEKEKENLSEDSSCLDTNIDRYLVA